MECPYCALHRDVADAERDLTQVTATMATALLRLVDVQRKALAVQSTILDDLYVGLTAIARHGRHDDDPPARVQ